MRIILSILLLSVCYSDIIHVPDNYGTIQEAIDASSDGDTVLVSAGTYLENINFNGKNIALIGEDRETTIIDGGQNGSVVLFENGEDSTAVLSGFTIQNGSGTLHSHENYDTDTEKYGGGIFIRQFSKPIIKNVTIRNNLAYHGAGVAILTSVPTFLNCLIEGNQTTGEGTCGGMLGVHLDYWGIGGGYLLVENSKITNNFSENGGSGVHLHQAGNTTIFRNTEISNNYSNSGVGGIQNMSSSAILEYCTITDNHTNNNQNSGGIYASNYGNAVLKGTIATSNSPFDVLIGTGTPHTDTLFVEYSLINGGINSITVLEGGVIVWGEGNIDADPHFVDPANGNYHLSDYSPCIGAGTLGGAPDTDIEGNPRPNPSGTLPDMGAYENALANPIYILSVDSVYIVHGDTAIVPIRNHSFLSLLYSIDLNIIGLQEKLEFVDLVTDTNTIFGSQSWITQYNNTDTLLITASAGSNPIDSIGILFALKLAVSDTLSSQFIPITITEFTGNTDYIDFFVTPGGVQVVWGPIVGYTSTQTTGAYPLEITFTDTSNSGTFPINEWAWDFGDGSTASGSAVNHTYNYPGVYDITLQIKDEFSLMDSITSSGLVQVDTLYGDVDWNALVQSYDASLILQDLAGMIELDTLQSIVGDVSGDSSLSTLDASLILQHVVGLIPAFPYGTDSQFSASGDLFMENQNAAPNTTASIPIQISNGSNIYGFEITIQFDPTILTLDTLIFSESLSDYLIFTNIYEDGIIEVVAAGSTPYSGNGEFASLHVHVQGDFDSETIVQVKDIKWNEEEIVENAAEMTLNAVLGISDNLIPQVYALHQSYPNPFNPVTTIQYDLPEISNFSLIVYNIKGSEVAELYNGSQVPGYYTIAWDASEHSSGVYFVKMIAGEFVNTQKLMLVK